VRLGIFAILTLLAACKGRGQATTPIDGAAPSPSTSASVATAADASAPDAARTQDEIVQTVMAAQSFQDAIRAAARLYPLGQPQLNAPGGGVGTVVVTTWAARHLVASDVIVPDNETAYGIALNHPHRERGRRLCQSGKIMYIKPQTEGPDAFYHGMFSSPAGMIEFMAVGSIGKLADGKEARFCGAVISDARYATKEGPAKALTLVGMFDLPQNKTDAGR
jgi:hypothetical protein